MRLISVGIGTLSLPVLFLGGEPGWAGICYFLLWPAHMIEGIASSIRAERIYQRLSG